MADQQRALEPRLKLLSTDGSAVKFDLARFSWIGTTLQEPQVNMGLAHRSARNVNDLKTNTIVMGATANSRQLCPAHARERPHRHPHARSSPAMSGRTRSTSRSSAAKSRATIRPVESHGPAGRLGRATTRSASCLQYGNQRLAALKDVPTVAD